jgi:hypothetical protein
MVGTLWISRLFAAAHPIVPQRFLGHTHVSSTRVDPGPHFPLHELREAVFDTPEIPLLSVPYLGEFQRRYEEADETLPYDDPFVSEQSLHLGLYRHDWDGRDSITDPEVEAERKRLELSDPDRISPDLMRDLKEALRRLGYYPGPIDDVDTSQELTDTIRLFQSRWKKRPKRGKRRRWVSAVPVTGKVNQQVFDLIQQFERQQWRLVS